MVSEINRLKSRKKLLFVNKKQQKNFVNLEFACTGLRAVDSGPIEQKFFGSFFQKRTLLSVKTLSTWVRGTHSGPPDPDVLALAELERTTGLGATILLALHYATVAGEETGNLQYAA